MRVQTAFLAAALTCCSAFIHVYSDDELRAQSNQLLLRAEKASLYSAGDDLTKYHVHMTFTLSGLAGGDHKGEYVKDFLSKETWQERVDVQDFHEIRVRNGDRIGERMNVTFEPALIYQLRAGIPPTVTHLGSNDVVHKITTTQIGGAAAHCIEFQTIGGKGAQEGELCVDDATGVLSRSRYQDWGFEWSDFTTFRDRYYPRHVIVKERGNKVAEAELEVSEAAKLTVSQFDFPADFRTEAVCKTSTAPVRIGGSDPAFPNSLGYIIGDVRVALKITKDGIVAASQVMESPGASLDPWVLGAVKDWKFEPATCDGVPREQRLTVLMHFR